MFMTPGMILFQKPMRRMPDELLDMLEDLKSEEDSVPLDVLHIFSDVIYDILLLCKRKF